MMAITLLYGVKLLVIVKPLSLFQICNYLYHIIMVMNNTL